MTENKLEKNIEKNPEEEKETYLKYTKKYLSDAFEITNLSTAEEIKLREIVNQCIKQWKQYTQKDQYFDIAREAAIRWIYQLYGKLIDASQEQDTIILKDTTDGKLYYFDLEESVENGLEQYDRKKSELDKKNHSNRLFSYTCSSKIRNELEVLRQDSHKF